MAPNQRKVVFLSTHAIQYLSPWFERLSQEPTLDLEVWYGHRATPEDQAGEGYGVEFDWDVPLLEGYRHRFLDNVADRPSLHGYRGIDIPGVSDLIRGEKPSAVVVNGWHFLGAWQTIRACWRQRVPVMVRSDSHLFTPRSSWKRALKWPAYRCFIPRFNACLAAGTWAHDYFRYYGASEHKLFRVPHSISADWLRSPLDSRPHRVLARKKYGFQDTDFVALFVGSLTRIKRPLDLIAALERLNNPRVCLLIAGDGPLKTQCEEAVRKVGVRARFCGFVNQSELPDVYAAGDVLILPSESETWGMVVNEAMASGVPAIVSDRVGCGPDLIRHGRNGFVYPATDSASLTERIRDCYQLRETGGLLAMREEAYRTIEQQNLSSATEGLLSAVSAAGGGR